MRGSAISAEIDESRPWEPERTVTPDRAITLLERRFSDLVPVIVEPFGDGWDNTAFLVNEKWVFRFPRREIAVPLMRTESCLLPRIASRLTLPVPIPVYLGEPGDDWPWPFAGYRLLPGRTLCRAAPGRTERAGFAVPLAAFLASLHAISPPEALGLGAGGDTLGRLALDRRIPMARDYLERLEGIGVIEDLEPFRREVERARALPSGTEQCLVHGDLYARHVLVGDTLEGVIDWGDVHIGDPASDLMAAHLILPPEAHAEFRREYGTVGDDSWRLARFRAVLHASIVAVYGHDIGDTDLVRESVAALSFIAEEIG